jgi:hypothetical protein
MLHPFRRMPYSFGRASSIAPTDAPFARNDAVGEARAALSGQGDALREPRDALLEARDALAIRGDTVQRRGGDSRRVTRLSSTSPGARSVSKATARTREAALTMQSDPSRAPRDAVDATRDTKRGEDDAHGEARKSVTTSLESSALLAEGSRAIHERSNVLDGRDEVSIARLSV